MAPLIKTMLLSAFILTYLFNNSAAVSSSCNLPYIIMDEIKANQNDDWKLYSSSIYKIIFRYPSDWKENKDYANRYEGKDGFFQVTAISSGLNIDSVTDQDAHHMAQPYGSNPQIIKVKIQGQEGRLILPSADQAMQMKNQAGLIIQYPRPIKIGSRSYNYFVLYGDKDHIQEISKTIKFI